MPTPRRTIKKPVECFDCVKKKEGMRSLVEKMEAAIDKFEGMSNQILQGK